jgi:hypothetical protein
MGEGGGVSTTIRVERSSFDPAAATTAQRPSAHRAAIGADRRDRIGS